MSRPDDLMTELRSYIAAIQHEADMRFEQFREMRAERDTLQAENEQLREALTHMADAFDAPYPDESEGLAAQTEWVDRRYDSIDRARALLASKVNR